MLDSAVNSPMNLKHYGGQNNLFQLATKLSEKLAKNSAFQDGNKRVALVAADMFLKINGYRLQETPLKPDANSGGLTEALVKVTTDLMTAEEFGRYYESIATVTGGSSSDIQTYLNEATPY